MKMNRNQKIALEELSKIINDFNLNSQITESVETGEPFVIVEEWTELGTIQRELNRAMAPRFFYKHYIDFLNERGNEAFQKMRFEHNDRYEIPEGLHELEEWFEWGFSDEYTTCGNCGRSLRTEHSSYDDIPKFAILNDELLCHECIRDEFEEEYIESVTNNPKNALKLTIINESRLEELGWKELEEKYENGLHEGMNDDPKSIYNSLKADWDVLFTFMPSQFYIQFWAWVKPKEGN